MLKASITPRNFACRLREIDRRNFTRGYTRISTIDVEIPHPHFQTIDVLNTRVSCVKTAEPIEMLFEGLVFWVCGTMYYTSPRNGLLCYDALEIVLVLSLLLSDESICSRQKWQLGDAAFCQITSDTCHYRWCRRVQSAMANWCRRPICCSVVFCSVISHVTRIARMYKDFVAPRRRIAASSTTRTATATHRGRLWRRNAPTPGVASTMLSTAGDFGLHRLSLSTETLPWLEQEQLDGPNVTVLLYNNSNNNNSNNNNNNNNNDDKHESHCTLCFSLCSIWK